MVLALLTATVAFGSIPSTQDEFPDIAANHWLYEGVAYLKTHGLYFDPIDGLAANPGPITRWTLAVNLYGTADNLKKHSEELESQIRQVEQTPAGPKAEDLLGELAHERNLFECAIQPRNIDFLLRVKKEFAPELKGLGVTRDVFVPAIEEVKLALVHWRTPIPGIALQQLKDVPTNHWAAQAVLDLRKVGLIDGYPDGTFKG